MSEARRVATYEDLRRLPDNVVGEIVDGELYASPRPALPHINVNLGVGADLRYAFGRRRGGSGQGGWWILAEPELHLGPDVLVPDVAGWRRARLPEVPSQTALELAPDWICEILSPSTASLDRYRKLPAYARAEVAHAWLIDPVLRSVEIYRLHAGHWLFLEAHVGDDPFRAEPFADLELDPTEWWVATDVPPTRPG